MQRMTPEFSRAQSTLYQKEGRRLRTLGNYEQAFNHYIIAITILSSMEDKNAQDNRNISGIHYAIATMQFNTKQYLKAAEHYNAAIKSLESIETLYTALEDKDYRELVRIYTDLSDACLHLNYQSEANLAFSNSIKAFNLIQVKNPGEQQVANANDNYASFRNFYEKQTSSTSYRTSTAFVNHQQLLYDKRDENNLLLDLDNLAVSEQPMSVEQLALQMNNISVAPQPLFAQIPIQQRASDAEYRHVAHEFINLSNRHYAQQKIADTIDTLKQAVSTFQKIQVKQTEDIANIQALEQQINQLIPPVQPQNINPFSNLQQPSHGMASVCVMGMYGTQTQRCTNPPPDVEMQQNNVAQANHTPTRMDLS